MSPLSQYLLDGRLGCLPNAVIPTFDEVIRESDSRLSPSRKCDRDLVPLLGHESRCFPIACIYESDDSMQQVVVLHHGRHRGPRAGMATYDFRASKTLE